MTGSPATAQLTAMTDKNGKSKKGAAIKVHFNPETLTLTIRNTMEAAKKKAQAGRPAQQLVSASEVTLALQLLFDTTLTGVDVRSDTGQIAEMMRPGATVSGEEGKRRPAVALFEWNAFAFQGVITDYTETLDYFSPEGIPLRSNLNLTLTKHEAAFPAAGGQASDVGAGAGQPTVPVSSGDSVSDIATGAGSPDAAPALAEANAVEDIRDPEVDELAEPEAAMEAAAAAGAFGSPLGGGAGAFAGAGISFGAAPAAFASGDAGFGLDLGLSAGASAGIGFSAGASLAAGASLGGGAEAGFGAIAAAGASFDAGLELDAFAGLNAPSIASASASLSKSVSFDLGAEAGIGLSLEAGVSLGGAAGISLGAGAGAGASIGGGQVASVGKEINLADILFKEDV
jgi:hypothetical protein